MKTNQLAIWSAAIAVGMAALAEPAAAQRKTGRNESKARTSNEALDAFETKVAGKLIDFDRTALLVESKQGSPIKVPFATYTRLQVRAPANDDLLQEGRTVEVYGTAISGNTIDKPQITVFLNTAQINSSYGRVYVAKATSAKEVPVVIIGTVVKRSPLLVKASNSVTSEYYFDADVGRDGVVNRTHSFPTLNKIFEVRMEKSEKRSSGLYVDLGDAIRYAGENASVDATVDARTGVARIIYVHRKEPLAAEEISVGKKSGKSTRSKDAAKSKRSSRSKKDAAKSKDDG